MKKIQAAQSGVPNKKGDLFIKLTPREIGSGTSIELVSSMKKEFGQSILSTTTEILAKYNVEDVLISIEDKGAMDFALRARLETVLRRAGVGGII